MNVKLLIGLLVVGLVLLATGLTLMLLQGKRQGRIDFNRQR